MRILKYLIVIIVVAILYSCSIFQKCYCDKKLACKKHPILLEDIKIEMGGFINNSEYNFLYEDFQNEDLSYGNVDYKEAWREGKIINGYKEGIWISATYLYDTINNTKKIDKLFKEEHFKKGLRDSIFRQFDSDGKIIYETTFKMGTGLWKEFHYNGKLYFEAQTQDGYFNDTLKLYDFRGRLQGLRFYKKDSLFYSKDFDTDVVDTIENGKKVRITYKNDKVEKKEFGNETWWYEKGKLDLKSKDTVVNDSKKRYLEYIDGESVIKTVYILNNPKIEYELVSRYSKNILKSQIKVNIDKNGNAIETETTFDEEGKIGSITTRSHKAYEHIVGNYKYEKTDFYKLGKKYQWSELIYKETQIKKDVIKDDERLQFKELNYYNLKNELVKKIYIKNTSGKKGGGCEGFIPYEIEEIIKTEYFEKGKLIKTEQGKTQ